MENVNHIKELQQGFKENIELLETSLSSGIIHEPLDTTLSEGKLTSIQKAQLLNSYAYCLSTLYFVLLKSSGNIKNNGNQEKIMSELNRVKGFMNRVNVSLDSTKAKSEKEIKTQEESKRFITAQLNGASFEPSVSKSHFKSKHTKFTDEDENTTNSSLKKGKKLKVTHGRVSKPKSKQ